MSTPEDILSIETSRITNYLTDQLIEGLVDDADLRSPLRELRSTIWPLDAAERPDSHAARLGKVNEKSRKIDPGKYQEIIDSVPEARRGAFMEHVAQMGHLRQLASLVARDNFFQQRFSDKGEAVVGSGEEFINNSNGDVSELLNSINGVTFNPVFTAHPTNNNALTSMKALGDVGRAITSFRSNPEAGDDSVKDAVAAYAKVAITPEENGHDRNLTAAEETQNMLHFMGEIYNELPATLAEYDIALAKKAQAQGTTYDPLKLQPQYKFDSWGSSGDKDGNKQVNATTALDAILQHRMQALTLYIRDLETILADRAQLREVDSTLLGDWKEKLERAKADVQGIRVSFDAAVQEPGAQGMLPDALFNSLSGKLAEVYNEKTGLKISNFITQLENSYPHAQGAAQQNLLGLVRRARIFGDNFGRLEYRETAEEFGRVVKLVLGNEYPLLSPSELVVQKRETDADKAARATAVSSYIAHVESLGTEEAQAIAAKLRAVENVPAELSKLLEESNILLEEKRTAIITAALQDPQKLEAMKALLPEIAEKGAQQAYSDSPYPIAYQTIKRMELARDFPKSVVKQVLAECQAPSNVLEAKLLMRLTEKNGKEAVLGIVPLFEEPLLLAGAHETMRTIVTNDVYKEHLELFRQTHPEECAPEDGVDLADGTYGKELPRRITQEVQFAHSDNGRRGGMPAARAYIYEAHENLQVLGKELGMSFREFHGGSASDPYRGGTRSYIGMIRDYQLQDSFKLTLQGGDLLNMFNYQGSIQRYLGGVLQYCAKQRLKPEQRVSTEIDKMARESLMGTLKDYTKRVFNNLSIGALFAALADLFDLGAGAVGTRAQRKGVGFDHEETPEGDAAYLNPKSIRTITFSELLQHNQINPTWVGALELSNNIRAVCGDERQMGSAIKELENTQPQPGRDVGIFRKLKNFFLNSLGLQQESPFDRAKREMDPEAIATMDDKDFYATVRGLHPGVVQYMYRRSPAFRDVMDRMAFGIATTNLSAVEHHHKAELDENPQARNFLRVLKMEYVKAASIVYAAMTGQYMEAEKEKDRVTKGAELHELVATFLPGNTENPQWNLAGLQDAVDQRVGIKLDLEALRQEPGGFTAALIERKLNEQLRLHSVPSDGLNLERVRDKILTLPRLQHLSHDVADNMALLDFVNSFKTQLRREYKAEDKKILHKVNVERASDKEVHIYLGECKTPVVVNLADRGATTRAVDEHGVEIRTEAPALQNDVAVKLAIGDELGTSTQSGYQVQFETSKGHMDAQVQSDIRYTVRITSESNPEGVVYTIPYKDWVKIKDEIQANGLEEDVRKKLDDDRKHVFRVVHCAADTATHVYYPTAGDRAYSDARFPRNEQSIGRAA